MNPKNAVLRVLRDPPYAVITPVAVPAVAVAVPEDGGRKSEVYPPSVWRVVAVYRTTATYPKQEVYGLSSQTRRAAVSVPSNIVEGASRETQIEFVRFLDIAYGSCHELKYQLGLAKRLGFGTDEVARAEAFDKAERTAQVLAKLIGSLRR